MPVTQTLPRARTPYGPVTTTDDWSRVGWDLRLWDRFPCEDIVEVNGGIVGRTR